MTYSVASFRQTAALEVSLYTTGYPSTQDTGNLMYEQTTHAGVTYCMFALDKARYCVCIKQTCLTNKHSCLTNIVIYVTEL